MLWVSYGKVSKEGMKGMLTNPQNREAAVAKLVEGLGGKLISYYMLLKRNSVASCPKRPASWTPIGILLPFQNKGTDMAGWSC